MAIIDINAAYIALPAGENDSRKGMVYTDDNGNKYKVIVGEIAGELLGFDDITTEDEGLPSLPIGFTMRKITYSSADGKSAGSLNVGKATEAIFTEGGTVTQVKKGSVLGTVCTVTGSQGEKKRFIGANDTGQNAGDVT